ncbi:MAG: YpdA family putative bacillithiol disulfide reductase [Bacteroidetes bacterium]|nr:YpdA family putative bacillithiol disulfide reductase [Bacteroidota bacterium]
MRENSYDIVVIGAGPAGLSVGIEASKNNLSCLIVDRGSVVNTIRRYPTYAVFFSTAELLELDRIPFPAINKQPTRHEALKYYNKVADYFNLNFSLYTNVEGIARNEFGFTLTTSKGEILAKNLVVAIGYYEKHNYLNVPGESLSNVQHFYTEPFAYARQKVTVVGGSNSAGEAALDLFRNGAEVTLVHRGSELYPRMKYWVKPDLENRIKEGSIKAYFNATVAEIKADKVLINAADGKHEIPTDHVLALIGYHPDVEFLKDAGVEFDTETYIPSFNLETLESNVPNLYLAGTVLAGKNTGKIFIENSRHHGKQIVDAIWALSKKAISSP